MQWLLIAPILLLAGCINIAASVQPEDSGVPGVREASDCVPIIFGFAYGSATLEGALSEEVRTIESVRSRGKVKSTAQKITKIRRVQLHDYSFLMFGARCVEVFRE